MAIKMSERRENFSEVEFRRRIAQLVAMRHDQALDQLNVGRSLLEVSSIAQDEGLIVPGELVLIGKTMLQLDEIGRILDPTFDTNASIRRNVAALMSRHLRKDFTQGSVYGALLDAKDFAMGLPARLNRIMDTVTNSELEVKVRVTDVKTVLDGLHKIANRITMGIALAGLVVGASLLMRDSTPGYRKLAITCFVGAAAGGFWLVIRILVSDYKSRKQPLH